MSTISLRPSFTTTPRACFSPFSGKRFFFDIICKFSFEMDLECFIPSLPDSKLTDSFDLASKLLVQRAMSLSPLMKTETITEH
ncbi:hypothetical protein AHAS_Ahas14G0216700 [Arachis hypogaea]